LLKTIKRAAVALALVGAACARREGTPPSGELAREAFGNSEFDWRVAESPQRGLRLYLQRGSDADEQWQALTGAVVNAQVRVLALLGEPLGISPDSTADLFFVGSREDMNRLAGRPFAGFVQPGERTAFFVWSSGYRAPLAHELSHLYTFSRWGAPAAGDSAAWLVEGIGAWAGGPCQGHTNRSLAAGLLARNALPSLDDLAQRFRSLPEDVAVPAAGSLVELLHEREGVAGLRRRWQSSAKDALPDAAVVAQWQARVKAATPAQLDVGRLMREGC
jgi:hypothetical protein